MDFAFETKLLRDVCESTLKAERKYGIILAKKLRQRLAELRAAETVSALVVGNPKEVQGSSPPCLSMDLGHGNLLVVTPNPTAIPMLKSGRVDWGKVNRVKIVRIEVVDEN